LKPTGDSCTDLSECSKGRAQNQLVCDPAAVKLVVWAHLIAALQA
jgi:hypothetical protein